VKSREILADFWDNHSLADYWDELPKIEVKFAKRLSRSFTVRFDDTTAKEIERQAHDLEIGAPTLIRMLTKHELKIERPPMN
jgi:ribosome maturation factor RimP